MIVVWFLGLVRWIDMVKLEDEYKDFQVAESEIHKL